MNNFRVIEHDGGVSSNLITLLLPSKLVEECGTLNKEGSDINIQDSFQFQGN